MTTSRTWFIASSLVLAVACGGSGKASETPAAATADQTAASADTASTDATTKSESAAPKAEESKADDPGPACSKDQDCMIFSDCCSCKAVLAKGPPTVPCDAVCGESKCEVKGKTADNVACVDGHCKLK